MGLWHLGQTVVALWEEGCGSHGAVLATPQLPYRLPWAAGARFPRDAPAWLGQNPGASQRVSWVSCCLSFYRGPSCGSLPSVQAAWLAPTHTHGALTS